MWQSLDSEVDVTATGLAVLCAKMVDGCSRFKVGSILASIMQIRLECNALRYSKRLTRFALQFFS